MNCDSFIQKLNQLPDRVLKNKFFYFSKNILVKTADIEDFLTYIYKDMPESLRLARKKGMKTSFKSFKLLEQLDKIFISKSFLNKMGLAIVNIEELNEHIKLISRTIKEDEIKIQTILENR